MQKMVMTISRTLMKQSKQTIISIIKGMEFMLTKKLREYISSLEKDPEHIILYDRDVKKLLWRHYGDEIQFALDPQQDKSELVFLSCMSSADVASKINNINTLNSSGESLR